MLNIGTKVLQFSPPYLGLFPNSYGLSFAIVLELCYIYWKYYTGQGWPTKPTLPTLRASVLPATTATWRAVWPFLFLKSRWAPPPAKLMISSRHLGLHKETAKHSGVSAIQGEQILNTSLPKDFRILKYLLRDSICSLLFLIHFWHAY